MIPGTYQVEQPGNSAGDLDALPPDTYEVVIEDITLKTDQAVYNKPDEKEDKFAFKFRITEEGAFKGRILWLDVRPIMSAGGSSFSPSWLYKIYGAVNQARLTTEQAKEVGSDQVNAMTGKGLRVVVQQKTTQKGDLRNRITDVLPLKGGAIPVEDVKVEDIPF